MLPLLFLLIPVGIFAGEDRFLFPHGFFDSSKIKPWDAMYMNMMAQSNLEYGGTTLEELKPLEDDRKVKPRPTELVRTREEDDPALDVKPKEAPAKQETPPVAPMDPFGFAASTGIPSLAREGEAKGPKPKPSRQHDAPLEGGGNPFEEIVTRKPPRSNQEFGKLRRRLHGGRKRSHKHRHHKHDDDLSIEEDSVVKPKHHHRATTSPPLDDVTPPPTLIPKIRRLPNNPFRGLDTSKPTVLRLPYPPNEEFNN